MDDCDEYANCTNTIGSFLCMCRVGFTGDGVSCAGNNYVVCKLNSLVRMGEGWGYCPNDKHILQCFLKCMRNLS